MHQSAAFIDSSRYSEYLCQYGLKLAQCHYHLHSHSTFSTSLSPVQSTNCIHSRKGTCFITVTLNFIKCVTFKTDLQTVKMNQQAKYLGQRSFRSKAIAQTHTLDTLLYLDHCKKWLVKTWRTAQSQSYICPLVTFTARPTISTVDGQKRVRR